MSASKVTIDDPEGIVVVYRKNDTPEIVEVVHALDSDKLLRAVYIRDLDGVPFENDITISKVRTTGGISTEVKLATIPFAANNSYEGYIIFDDAPHFFSAGIDAVKVTGIGNPHMYEVWLEFNGRIG